MKKLVISTILLIMALTGCSQETETREVSLLLDYTPNTNHTGIYVAESLGYYDDVGIDLDITQPGASGVEQVVATGQIDFGISYEDYVSSAVANDLDLKALATITTHSTVGPISRKDRGLTDPSEWTGATYCGWGTPIEEAFIKKIATDYGVDPVDIDFQVSTQTFLAETNTCDIFWGYEAWENAQATLDGIEYDYTPARDTIDYYPTVIITSDKLIDDDPQLVSDFMQATKKGYEYAAAKPEEAADIFLEANPEFDPELITTSQQIISPNYVNEQGKFGIIDDTVWTEFTDFMIDSGIIDESSREAVNSAYTNEYIGEGNAL